MYDRGRKVCVKGSKSVDSGDGGDVGGGGGSDGGGGVGGGGGGIYVTIHPNYLLFIIIACLSKCVRVYACLSVCLCMRGGRNKK